VWSVLGWLAVTPRVHRPMCFHPGGCCLLETLCAAFRVRCWCATASSWHCLVHIQRSWVVPEQTSMPCTPYSTSLAVLPRAATACEVGCACVCRWVSQAGAYTSGRGRVHLLRWQQAGPPAVTFPLSCGRCRVLLCCGWTVVCATWSACSWQECSNLGPLSSQGLLGGSQDMLVGSPSQL
jgi:hypothetical protein